MATEKTIEATSKDLFVVDDGYREIPVYNTLHDQIGTLRYNPTDINIVNRFKEAADKFANILQPVTEANVTATGEGEGEDSVAIINKAQEELIEALDYVLASDSKKAFFAVTNPFSPCDGGFYCEKVIDQLGVFISKAFDTEITKVRTRIGTQTHGYRSGKHRKGRT